MFNFTFQLIVLGAEPVYLGIKLSLVVAGCHSAKVGVTIDFIVLERLITVIDRKQDSGMTVMVETEHNKSISV